MNPNLNEVGGDVFANYLQSIVKLNTLQKMTADLDEELADSQRVMGEIKALYESISKAQNNPAAEHSNGELRHEDLSTFLKSNLPTLLMPDMVENTNYVDLDDVICKIKSYVEELKKNFVLPQPQPRDPCEPIASLDIQQYATSLDQLGKRLSNIKLNKNNDANNRSAEVEDKLSQLCNDVHMFTQMIQAKTMISQSVNKWSQSQPDNNVLQYENIINKLLTGINEVSYLLQNKN